MDRDFGISEHVLAQPNPTRCAKRQIERARDEISNGPLVLDQNEPLRSARQFRERQRPTLMHFNDDWLAHDGAAYRDLEDATVRSELYTFLEKAFTPGKKNEPPVPFKPTKAKVSNVLDALEGIAHTRRDRYEPPCWLEGEGPPPKEVVACRNGLLHLPSGELLAPTPRFFTRNVLDFGLRPQTLPRRRHGSSS